MVIIQGNHKEMAIELLHLLGSTQRESKWLPKLGREKSCREGAVMQIAQGKEETNIQISLSFPLIHCWGSSLAKSIQRQEDLGAQRYIQ